VRLVTLLVLLAPSPALAGPPYVTDDPEPVPLGHWEVYLATQDGGVPGGETGGTAPHLEVNYGAAPDLQLHAIVPLAWSRAPGGPPRSVSATSSSARSCASSTRANSGR
jgi:hypothetical protein